MVIKVQLVDINLDILTGRILYQNLPEGQIPDLRKMPKVMGESLRRFAREEIQKRMERTIVGWQHDNINFKPRAKPGLGELAVYCTPTGPDAKYWLYVNEGVGPRIQGPRVKKAVAFTPGYRPHTVPGSLRSVPTSGVWGSKWAQNSETAVVRSKPYMWPGFEGRFFDELVAVEVEPMMAPFIQDEINRALESGELGTIAVHNYSSSMASTRGYIDSMFGNVGSFDEEY